MFSTSAWVLEQEYKAFRWFVDVAGIRRPDRPMSRSEALMLGFFGTGAFVAHGVLALQPYRQLAILKENIDITTRQASKKHMQISFAAGRRGYITRFAPRAGRMLVTKGLSRAIPYVGWGLLAADLWHLGKWIGEKLD